MTQNGGKTHWRRGNWWNASTRIALGSPSPFFGPEKGGRLRDFSTILAIVAARQFYSEFLVYRVRTACEGITARARLAPESKCPWYRMAGVVKDQGPLVRVLASL